MKKNTQIAQLYNRSLVYDLSPSVLWVSFLFFISSVQFTVPVFAAEIFFETERQDIGIEKQFEVSFFLNTEEDDINALEGSIVFPGDLIELQGIRDGSSIVSLWIERPQVISKNEIRFAGIFPGGYSDGVGHIFSMIFKARREGSGLIEISGMRVLLNDGQGTNTELTTKNQEFRILNLEEYIIPDSKFKIPKDTNPPEQFSPKIVRDNNVFDGKYFLIFAARDIGSGIDHYEIREGLLGKFVVAESPYLLENQNLDKKIFVKAVDRNGNERTETLRPKQYAPWYQNDWVSIILVIMVLIIISIIVRRKIL